MSARAKIFSDTLWNTGTLSPVLISCDGGVPDRPKRGDQERLRSLEGVTALQEIGGRLQMSLGPGTSFKDVFGPALEARRAAALSPQENTGFNVLQSSP